MCLDRILLFAARADERRIFSGGARHRVVFHWRVAVCFEHFHGTFYWAFGDGASSGLASDTLSGWRVDFADSRLGVRAFYLRSNVFTMPQFLERRFNRQCAVYLAGISIIAYIFTKISVQLYAASVVLERVAGCRCGRPRSFGDATGIYTIAGGLAAVIYTDTVQTLILITGGWR